MLRPYDYRVYGHTFCSDGMSFVHATILFEDDRTHFAYSQSTRPLIVAINDDANYEDFAARWRSAIAEAKDRLEEEIPCQ